MKKAFIFFSIISCFLVFNCKDFQDLSIPESVVIKSGAKYEASMGDGAIKIRDKAGIEKIQEVLDENIEKQENESTEKKVRPIVYEYNPTPEGNTPDETAVMQYIIEYPIKEIPLSLNEQTSEKTDMSNIEIPETEFAAPNFNDNISDTLTADASFQVVEMGGETISLDQNGEQIGFNFTITSPSFSTMTVRSGSMDIVLTTPEGVSPSFSLSASVKLVKELDKNYVIGASGSKTVSNIAGAKTTFSIDLTNKDIVQRLYIIVSGSISGGESVVKGHTNTYQVSMSPNNLQLAEIRGLTLTEADFGDTNNNHITINESFSIKGVNESLKEATIQDGSLDFFCRLPDGWSGITIKKVDGVEKSNFQAGQNDDGIYQGLNLANSDFTNKTEEGYVLYKSANLNGKHLNMEEVTTNGSWLEVEIKNATIIFPSEGTAKLTLGGVCHINELSNLKISLGQLLHFSAEGDNAIDTGLNFSSLLGDIMKGDTQDLIENIEFADSTEENGAKLSGYLYVKQPLEDNETLKKLSVEGNVKAIYTDKNENQGAHSPLLLYQTSGSNRLEMKTPTKTFSNLAKDGLITDSSIFDEDQHSGKIIDGQITTLINDKPDNLKITYDMGLSSGTAEVVELEGEVLKDLEALKQDAKISITLALVLPLQVKLVDKSDIGVVHTADNTIIINDVVKLSKQKDAETGEVEADEDVFKRKPDDDLEKWKKYAEGAKRFYLLYKVNNDLIINSESDYEHTWSDGTTVNCKKGESLPLKLSLYTVDESGNETNIIGTKELPIDDADEKFGKGIHKLEFSKDEIVRIFSKAGYPFIPKIRAEIPAHRKLQYVPRNGVFEVTGTVHVEFDENAEIEVWSK